MSGWNRLHSDLCTQYLIDDLPGHVRDRTRHCPTERNLVLHFVLVQLVNKNMFIVIYKVLVYAGKYMPSPSETNIYSKV